MTTHTTLPFSKCVKSSPDGLFASAQNTLEHAHSIARTIPFCLTNAEKQRRIERLLGYAVESFK